MRDRKEIARLWHEVGTEAARRVIYRFRFRHLDHDDLAQEAFLGFWRAVETHNPSKGPLRAHVYKHIQWRLSRIRTEQDALIKNREGLPTPTLSLDAPRWKDGKLTGHDVIQARPRGETPRFPWILARRHCTLAQRRVLWARFGLGLSLKEASKRLGISESSIETQTRRSVSKIQLRKTSNKRHKGTRHDKRASADRTQAA